MRVFIVEDHDVVRQCLAMLMSRRRDIEVVGEASTAAEAMEMVPELKPDVIVIDTHLPDQSGIAASREIRARYPNIRILILTAHGDDRAVLGSVMAGAAGYLLKEIRSQEIIQAIRKVAEGHSLLDPAVTRKVLERVRSGSDADDDRKLTEAEKRILELVTEGRNNPEIASEVSISESTVREHIMTIHGKLEITHRSRSVTWRARRQPVQSQSPTRD